MFTSRDHAASDPGDEAGTWVMRADSFGQLRERHRLAWDRLWERFEITTHGKRADAAPAAVARVPSAPDLVARTPSTSMSGFRPAACTARRIAGHVFWDELFVFPLLNYRLPILTRSLLEYRHRRLRAARWAAREQGYRGALFPWQSGSDGREETQRLHLNPRSGRWLPDHSHLQRHVNLAIALQRLAVLPGHR